MPPRTDPLPLPAAPDTIARPRKAIVLGFFSTVGDVECLQVVQRWLGEAQLSYEVAPYSGSIQSVMPGSVKLENLDPASYTHLIAVCGPCWEQLFHAHKIELARFDHCIRIGVNLTMIAPLETWNPFDVLLERDSNRAQRPDLSFLEATATVPVVGRCVIEQQEEYGRRQRHDAARRLIDELIARRGFATIEIDTRCRVNGSSSLRTPAAVLSLIGRVDFLLTTRLHGLAYAIKAGKPVIAVDPIAGGGKVSAQARAIGWPKIILAEDADAAWMDQAADWCLSSGAALAVVECQQRVRPPLESVKAEFLEAIHRSRPRQPSPPPAKKSVWSRLWAT